MDSNSATSKDALFTFYINEEIKTNTQNVEFTLSSPLKHTPSSDNHIFFDNSSKTPKKDKKIIIIGVAVAIVIIVIIIAAVILICEARKPAKQFSQENVEKYDINNGIGCEIDNPLYTSNIQEIDPFKDDFSDDQYNGNIVLKSMMP
ncbi:hypothetical protein TVAG_239130 [Trichomonas vaginalis G3]|uniref:Uncharacterized protein n=1 Tax=Trichomonas vaginalis (strain ATCC PRA-98 / G3) TaxID=412133 RepID=A2DGE4_TRIV3|nr:hypothetical protein TVAGG3_0966340 [Trichomonas vaginalis G3]EAY20540.1 hypothetical protein TVAG_239130 [Trichomonas vaginalis G3]KAI5488268.1 hypothetical protein TVAGG3_0966340 [Trichomonas vaginalis G3]|eukprot:XP_001581526.1 hypothetical protein [Trichomonas vaginalis G3]